MTGQDNQVVEMDGIVKECLPNAKFVIEVAINEKTLELEGHLSGKMRKHYIRVLEGDRVTVEVSSYDKEKARITYRHKN